MKKHADTIDRHFDLEAQGSGPRGLTLQNVVTTMENGTLAFPETASIKVKNEARLANSSSGLSTLSSL